MSKFAADYILMHQGKKFSGKTISRYKQEIGNVIKMHDIKTILDYGCGKAVPYKVDKIHEEWGVVPTLYDPFYEPLSTKPQGKFDAVLSVDVAEHVPEEEMDEYLQTLFSYATKVVVITFCNQPAKKTMPISGLNAHQSIHPREWWEKRIDAIKDKPYYLFENPSSQKKN